MSTNTNPASNTDLPLLRKSLLDSPIVKRGEYNYFINPITDGVPMIEPSLVDEVADRIHSMMSQDADVILTVEAMGIPVGTALSLKTGLPLAIVRKRPYLLPDEVLINQETGYSKGELYLNGIKKGDRVLIVDDVISTGGTLNALCNALLGVGAEIAGIFIIVGRSADDEMDSVCGVDVQTLVNISVSENGVEIVE